MFSKETRNVSGRKYFSSATNATMVADNKVEIVRGCNVVVIGIV